MPDITMCEGTGCPRKETCYRFTATPTPMRQSYFSIPPVKKDGTCHHYWEDKKQQAKLIKEIMDADKEDGLYDNEEPLLQSATFTFYQESNCVDGGEDETLEIRCESSLGIDNDGSCFFVLKTDRWSIDSVKELEKLTNRISKIVKK